MVLRNCLFIQRFRIKECRNDLAVTPEALVFPASSSSAVWLLCSCCVAVVTLQPVRHSTTYLQARRTAQKPRRDGASDDDRSPG